MGLCARSLEVLPVKHSIRRSAKAEAQHCRSLGAELAGSAERALILDIARAFEELGDVELNVHCSVGLNATRNPPRAEP